MSPKAEIQRVPPGLPGTGHTLRPPWVRSALRGSCGRRRCREAQRKATRPGGARGSHTRGWLSLAGLCVMGSSSREPPGALGPAAAGSGQAIHSLETSHYFRELNEQKCFLNCSTMFPKSDSFWPWYFNHKPRAGSENSF